MANLIKGSSSSSSSSSSSWILKGNEQLADDIPLQVRGCYMEEFYKTSSQSGSMIACISTLYQNSQISLARLHFKGPPAGCYYIDEYVLLAFHRPWQEILELHFVDDCRGVIQRRKVDESGQLSQPHSRQQMNLTPIVYRQFYQIITTEGRAICAQRKIMSKTISGCIGSFPVTICDIVAEYSTLTQLRTSPLSLPSPQPQPLSQSQPSLQLLSFILSDCTIL